MAIRLKAMRYFPNTNYTVIKRSLKALSIMKWLKYAKYRVLPIRIDPILELKDIVSINIELLKIGWL